MTEPEIIIGRRDFDVVAFDDYEADMRESSTRAAAVIESMQHQIGEAVRMLALVVLASGGKVEIPSHLMGVVGKLDDVEITKWRDEVNNSAVIEVRRK